MRARAAALVPVLTTLAVLAPVASTSAQVAPSPPPFAFRTATLVRVHHAIELRLIAAAQVTVTVVVTRGSVRLGTARAALDRGTTVVPVHVGPHGIKPLREGLHVKLAIDYGTSQPVRATPTLHLGNGASTPTPTPPGGQPPLNA